MENRLATIVFIDMQGYTKRSAQQTIEEMKLFHDEMFTFVKNHLDKYQGIMVKTLGDGFLARFDSPTQAVQSGLEMQRKLEARNAQMLNPDSIVRFRIGINTGEIGIDESGDVFGDPVNIASRIQSYAEPNEVYISESTFLAMNRNEVGAQDLGMQMFKNATREIRIYKILKQGSPGLVLPAGGSRVPGATANMAGTPGRPAVGSGTSAASVQFWLKVGVAIFVGAMFLTGVKHTFKRGKSLPQAPSGQLAPPSMSPTLAPDAPPPVAVPAVAKPVTKPAPPQPAEQQPLPLKQPGPVTAQPSVQVASDADDDVPPAQGAPISALEIDPDNPPPHLGLNQKQKAFLKDLKKLYKAGNIDQAIKMAEEQEAAVKQAPPPKRVDFYVLLGELYQKAGKKAPSIEAFNQARECLGKNPIKRKFLEWRIQAIQSKAR